ncbi:DNA polymerase III subunit chi [Tropicimonas sp. IMCC34011]|uniref:DNA polymerase III subunit chi n=1 Tax=Tropicimonas sp. IMCC34011 TaxID=2248759 RepID=UPI000E248B98|nr:DNA polymerase III subunit chi [Tropicimonas sp. IMCC34011]
MGQALFYHLTQQPLEVALPRLLERSLQRQWKVAVRGRDPARMAALDKRLWTDSDDSFLPHGLAGGEHDADQPILLMTEAGPAPNGATVLMAVDGAPVETEEIAAMERVCILFDGHDEAAVIHARGQWKALTGAGAKAEYWSEESGRWEKKAESG